MGDQIDIFQANPITPDEAKADGWIHLADAPEQDCNVEILTSESAHFEDASKRDGAWVFQVKNLHGREAIYYQIHGPMYWRPKQEQANG